MSDIIVNAFEVKAPSLDPVRVIYQDIGPGQGRIIIECFGEAWSSYWGGMGNRSVLQFVQDCTTEYLVMNLQRGPVNKQKREYLTRIVNAIKSTLAAVPDSEPMPTLTIRQIIDGLCELASFMPSGDLTPVLAWNRCKSAVDRPDILTIGTVQSGVKNNKPVAVITLDGLASKE